MENNDIADTAFHIMQIARFAKHINNKPASPALATMIAELRANQDVQTLLGDTPILTTHLASVVTVERSDRNQKPANIDLIAISAIAIGLENIVKALVTKVEAHDNKIIALEKTKKTKRRYVEGIY